MILTINMTDHKETVEAYRLLKVHLGIKQSKANVRPHGAVNDIQGIYWDRSHQKYRVQIVKDGQKYHVGYHRDFTEAVAHRVAIEQCLGIDITISGAWDYLVLTSYRYNCEVSNNNTQ